jgi:hypothetical protein
MRVGIPLVGAMFLGVVFAVFVYLMLKTEGARKPEGQLKTVMMVCLALLGLEAVFGCFLLLSTIGATGLTIAFLPLVSIWGLKQMDKTFLLAGALTQVWLLWRIIGVTGPNGLYDVLRSASDYACVEMFDVDDLCKSGWVAFLMFLTLLLQLFSMVLTPGLLFFAGEAHNYARGGSTRGGSGPSGHDDHEKHDGSAEPLLN